MTTFHTNVLNIYGKKGEAWLKELPVLVSKIASKLDLHDLKEIDNLSYNYVLSGLQGDSPIILKIGLDKKGLDREAFALRCFSGYGAVNVLFQEDGVLLLEKVVPGISLKSHIPKKEKTSIEIACSVMKKLHQAHIPSTHHLPHMKEWLTILDHSWNIPDSYLRKARDLRDRLLSTAGPDVLLHGDLHHDNILKNGSDWAVIDPKGVIGSPMNEIWAFVMDIEKDIPFTAQYFSFKTQDVFDWYFVHLILAACWNLEDNMDASFFLVLAQKAYAYAS